jgi:tRNA dimethylallyltransferase
LITILGPTASGKTALAARVAYDLNGEVISADSRQVYRGMNLGTGKDYDDYTVKGQKIPNHLIDIVEPGYEYNVFEYQQDFVKAYNDIISRGKLPILCGGSGMYLEAVLKGYRMKPKGNDPDFRHSLERNTDDELRNILKELRTPHNITDLADRERLIRAIEIASATEAGEKGPCDFPQIRSMIFGIRFEREELRWRITDRLARRLENGMIEEVQELLKKGLTIDQLKFYGLEYKYIAGYLNEETDYDTMFRLLNTAIHQFAKRQMTWFRRMERNGIMIHWIDGAIDPQVKVGIIETQLEKF